MLKHTEQNRHDILLRFRFHQSGYSQELIEQGLECEIRHELEDHDKVTRLVGARRARLRILIAGVALGIKGVTTNGDLILQRLCYPRLL